MTIFTICNYVEDKKQIALQDKLELQLEVAGFTRRPSNDLPQQPRTPFWREVSAGCGLYLEVWVGWRDESTLWVSIFLKKDGCFFSMKLYTAMAEITEKEAGDPGWFTGFMVEFYKKVTGILGKVSGITAAGAFTGLI